MNKEIRGSINILIVISIIVVLVAGGVLVGIKYLSPKTSTSINHPVSTLPTVSGNGMTTVVSRSKPLKFTNTAQKYKYTTIPGSEVKVMKNLQIDFELGTSTT